MRNEEITNTLKFCHDAILYIFLLQIRCWSNCIHPFPEHGSTHHTWLDGLQRSLAYAYTPEENAVRPRTLAHQQLYFAGN
jgi:hypothetical protein